MTLSCNLFLEWLVFVFRDNCHRLNFAFYVVLLSSTPGPPKQNLWLCGVCKYWWRRKVVGLPGLRWPSGRRRLALLGFGLVLSFMCVFIIISLSIYLSISFFLSLFLSQTLICNSSIIQNIIISDSHKNNTQYIIHNTFITWMIYIYSSLYICNFTPL